MKHHGYNKLPQTATDCYRLLQTATDWLEIIVWASLFTSEWTPDWRYRPPKALNMINIVINVIERFHHIHLGHSPPAYSIFVVLLILRIWRIERVLLMKCYSMPGSVLICNWWCLSSSKNGRIEAEDGVAYTDCHILWNLSLKALFFIRNIFVTWSIWSGHQNAWLFRVQHISWRAILQLTPQDHVIP